SNPTNSFRSMDQANPSQPFQPRSRSRATRAVMARLSRDPWAPTDYRRPKKYVSRDAVHNLINSTFCPDAVKQKVLDKDSASISRTYLKGTPEEVNIAIDWKPGVQFVPDIEECVMRLHEALDGCPNDRKENPMNWKSHSLATVELKDKKMVTYRLTPLADRPPRPKERLLKCEAKYKVLRNGVAAPGGRKDISIWGTWVNSDFVGRVKHEMKGCDLDTDSFKIDIKRDKSDGREWTINPKAGGPSKCPDNAIGTAFGVKDFDCKGIPHRRSLSSFLLARVV
ncbi:hypothetical protein FQN49_002260, partial [Arthroderma sp. PD_2]